jgi:hypothetical protein
MRRIAIVLLLPLLAVVLASPVTARTPNRATAGVTPKAKVVITPKVTVATAEQGGLDIDVTPASGPSTKVTIDYELRNGRVVASTACIGQFDAATGESAWGCGTFALSSLSIIGSVTRAQLAPVSIPVDRCNAGGSCTAGTVTIAADLTSVRSSYEAGRNRTDSRVAACKVVTTTSWENTAATGVLTVDGANYTVAAPDAAALAFPAIRRSPSTTRTTCY